MEHPQPDQRTKPPELGPRLPNDRQGANISACVGAEKIACQIPRMYTCKGEVTFKEPLWVKVGKELGEGLVGLVGSWVCVCVKIIVPKVLAVG